MSPVFDLIVMGTISALNAPDFRSCLKYDGSAEVILLFDKCERADGRVGNGIGSIAVQNFASLRQHVRLQIRSDIDPHNLGAARAVDEERRTG